MKIKEKTDHKQEDCAAHLRAISDTQYVLSGKWKVVIIGSLSFSKKRFTELRKTIEGIGSKMLTKELQELVQNGIVKRSLIQDDDKAIQYELTEYGYSVKPVIDAMAAWGKQHRDYIIAKMRNNNPNEQQ